jgi:hypothetical protein
VAFPSRARAFTFACSASSVVILLAELRLRRAEIGGLLGGALGTVPGMFAALLVTLVISRTGEPQVASKVRLWPVRILGAADFVSAVNIREAGLASLACSWSSGEVSPSWQEPTEGILALAWNQ